MLGALAWEVNVGSLFLSPLRTPLEEWIGIFIFCMLVIPISGMIRALFLPSWHFFLDSNFLVLLAINF